MRRDLSITRISNAIFVEILRLTGFYRFKSLSNLYWNFRAPDLARTYHDSDGDFAELRSFLCKFRPKRLLDVGCGRGRLFPLFISEQISEVVGQDISRVALNMAEEKFPDPRFRLVCCDIELLDFSRNYFELALANHVMQHIHPSRIAGALIHLSTVAQKVLIYELASPELSRLPYVFSHSYDEIAGRCGLAIIESGTNENHKWLVLEKIR